MAISLRISGDIKNPPYSYQILGPSNIVLETILSNNEQQLMTQTANDCIWKITDSMGNYTQGRITPAISSIMQTYFKGNAVPNGDKNDHIAAIDNAVANGWNFVGISFAISNAMGPLNPINGVNGWPTDARWNDSNWNIPFDSFSGTPYFYYDSVVKYAREKGIKLKVNFQYTLPLQFMIGGEKGVTFSYAESDYMLRSDGTPVTKLQPGAIVPFDTNPSIKSTQYNIYKKAATLKLLTRYQTELLSARIIGVCPLLAKSAETHFEHELTNNNVYEGATNGDYHTGMVDGFRTYCQTKWPTISEFNIVHGTSFANFAAINRSTIGGITSYNSLFRRRWYNYNGEELKSHLFGLFDYCVAAIPALNSRIFILDLGDIADTIGRSRGMYAIDDFCKHPNLIMIKSNPAPALYTKEISINQLASLAENYSLKAMVEPTAPDGTIGNATPGNDENKLIEMINYAKLKGVSVSLINVNSQLANVKALTGLAEFNTVNRRNVLTPNGKIIPCPYTLSQILIANGAYGNSNPIQTAILAHNPGAPDVVISVVNDLNESSSNNIPPSTTLPTITTLPVTGNQTNVVPSGLQQVSVTYDEASRDTSVHILGSLSTVVRVSAATVPQPNGLTWVNNSNDTTWNHTTFVQGTTQYAQSGYTKIYRFNPSSAGVGGIVNDKVYYIDVKLNGQNDFFRIIWSKTTGSIVAPQTLYNIGETTTVPTGDTATLIQPTGFQKLAITYNATTHEASVNAVGAANMLLRVSSNTAPQPSGLSWTSTANDTIWNSTTYIFGTTQFAATGYTKVFRLNPQTLNVGGLENNKTYYLDVKNSGSNQYFRVTVVLGTVNINTLQVIFDSTLSTTTLAPVATTTLAPGITTTQLSVAGQVLTPVILQTGNPIFMALQITPDTVAGTYKITDTTVRTPPNGYHWWYWVGAKIVRTNTRLIDEVWKGNQPGQVTKMAIKSEIVPTINPTPNLDSVGPVIALIEKSDVGGITTFYFKNTTI